MQICGCQTSSQCMQMLSMVTKIPARRMKNFLNRGRMRLPWRRRLASLWMAWKGENLQDVLGFPDKADQRAEPGSGWTPAELNHILTAHVMDGAVTTFGCVEWESQLFRGVMRARCYPFNLPKRRFHSFNPQVHCTLIHIGTYQYVRLHTRTYLVFMSMYNSIPRMILLRCSCTGYCSDCSAISLLH